MWLLLAAASHFSMIGFPVNVSDLKAMSADVMSYAQKCERIPVEVDKFVCAVRDSSGAELWIGLKTARGDSLQLETLNPAYRGEGRTDLVIVRDVSAAEYKSFEVTIQAEFAHARTPIIFDLADPREAKRFAPKARVTADITAFPNEISFFDNEQAYYARQPQEKIKFAANHFVPSGMFFDGAKPADRPTADALFAGKIVKSELRQNATGKARYWWFLVEAYDGALFNVVVDPEQVPGPPKIGGILAGSFWLSARVK